jgi:hypothetical protein
MICDNTDDATWDRRNKHRRAGVDAVYRSRDFLIMQSMISDGELSAGDAPQAPDPNDRACGKRQWERSMRAWRDAVKNYIQ